MTYSQGAQRGQHGAQAKPDGEVGAPSISLGWFLTCGPGWVGLMVGGEGLPLGRGASVGLLPCSLLPGVAPDETLVVLFSALCP